MFIQQKIPDSLHAKLLGRELNDPSFPRPKSKQKNRSPMPCSSVDCFYFLPIKKPWFETLTCKVPSDRHGVLSSTPAVSVLSTLKFEGNSLPVNAVHDMPCNSVFARFYGSNFLPKSARSCHHRPRDTPSPAAESRSASPPPIELNELSYREKGRPSSRSLSQPPHESSAFPNRTFELNCPSQIYTLHGKLLLPCKAPPSYFRRSITKKASYFR